MKKKSEQNTSEPKSITRPHAIIFTDPSLTRGSFKDECDVNRIVANYRRTGLINHVGKRTPQYGDAPEIDFTTAACIQAEIASHEAEAAMRPETPSPAENGEAESTVESVEKAVKTATGEPSEPVGEGA